MPFSSEGQRKHRGSKPGEDTDRFLGAAGETGDAGQAHIRQSASATFS